MTRLSFYLALVVMAVVSLGAFTGSAAAATTFTGTATVTTGGQTFSVPATAVVSNSGTVVTGIAFASDVAGADGSFDFDTAKPGWLRISTLTNSSRFRLQAADTLGGTTGKIYGPPASNQYRLLNTHSQARVTLYSDAFGPHVLVQVEGTSGTANFTITFTGS